MGKIAKWRNFTRQEIEDFVRESCSYATLAEKLGYNNRAGAYSVTMKTMVQELDLDVSHFKGQGWNLNNFDYGRFRKGSAIKTSVAVDALSFVRGRHCEKCQEAEWLGQPIPLEVHHEDGDPLNNEMDNLTLLCPNCHALTNNYRGKNINAGLQKVSDDDFAKALQDNPNIRQALITLGLTAKGDNYRRAREIIFKYNILHLMQEHQDEKSPT
jgi:hypothetical protein